MSTTPNEPDDEPDGTDWIPDAEPDDEHGDDWTPLPIPGGDDE